MSWKLVVLCLFGTCRHVESFTALAPKHCLTTHCISRRAVPSSLSLLQLQAEPLNNNHELENNDDDTLTTAVIPSYLLQASQSLRRVSWFSWWSQVILTTVSSVILGFARRTLIMQRTTALSRSPSSSSFLLSGIGLLVSAVSILWTWGNGSRLSRRLVRRPVRREQAADMLRRAVRVGVTINLVGLLVHLLAAEEIVGSLAIQVLTLSSSTRIGGFPEGMIQPLDVLVVQANTNSLLSHFCSLASLLFFTQQIDKLDPPLRSRGDKDTKISNGNKE